MSIRADQLAADELLDERFRIVRLLGEGGFSDSYEAIDERTGDHVVLKMPNLAIIGDPQTFERFRREMAIAKRLDHPNIQRSVDTGTSRSRPYMVLEYVPGVTLREHIRGHLPLPVDEVLRIGRQLASALAYAHERGVSHRDLKPENVLVRPDGTVKLFDFGIALLEGARRVTWRWLNNGAGTPDYMAPEQIQGKRGDERTDVYALGVMLYELLTGGVPFGGDNALAVMQQALNEPPPPVRSRRRDVPEALAAIVHRAMRKDPEERYPTMAALLTDLENPGGVDISRFPSGPEAPLRAVHSDRQIALLHVLVAVSFVAVVALALVLVALFVK
ncbi:MAG: serine/threonine-protein kinase [Candidatus Dormibacteria bacterium]